MMCHGNVNERCTEEGLSGLQKKMQNDTCETTEVRRLARIQRTKEGAQQRVCVIVQKRERKQTLGGMEQNTTWMVPPDADSVQPLDCYAHQNPARCPQRTALWTRVDGWRGAYVYRLRLRSCRAKGCGTGRAAGQGYA